MTTNKRSDASVKFQSTVRKQPIGETWVAIIRWIALAIFIGVPVFALFLPQYAGRVVWTMAVASIPLFIVLVGYHRWRLICPLAFFSQIPVKLRRGGTRKIQSEGNYYFLPLFIFIVSLWIRLIATNGSGFAIAGFFLLLSFAALMFGAFFTGKTWCNYVCPVSFIEKIYTEPYGLKETPNSQCAKCTACKKFCPDINEENGYWKELLVPAKRIAYYAFPGLVFGFYFYYFLQRGTWDYYFGGSWTNEPEVLFTAFRPGYDSRTAGFFFWPQIPRAWASLATLLAFALISVTIFYVLERSLSRYYPKQNPDTDKQAIRHSVFTVCAFVAFITFYSYAGQPTLRKVFPAPHFALILVLFTATVSFMRRLPRTQNAFAEETLARSILKRWEWTDMQPPENLREALLIHRIRTGEATRGMQKVLNAYKEAVRETLEDGFVSTDDVQRLESLRKQLGIKEVDHQKVMATLAEEERRLIEDPSARVQPEKRLQLNTYANALSAYLEESMEEGNTVEDSALNLLQSEYQINLEEHRLILDRLLGGRERISDRLAEQVAAIERMSATLGALKGMDTPAHRYFKQLVGSRRLRAAENLLRTLKAFVTGDKLAALNSVLCSDHEITREAAIRNFAESLPSQFASRLLDTLKQTQSSEAELSSSAEVLRARAKSIDPFIRACSLLALAEIEQQNVELLAGMRSDESAIVRETAIDLSNRLAGHSQSAAKTGLPLLTLEKMIALHAVPIFSSLEPQELEELARASQEDRFAAGEILCVEGEYGNEIFIIVDGQVEIIKLEDGEQRIVTIAARGDFLGELAVLDPAPRAASIVAASEGVRVLRLQGLAFQEALHSNPEIAHGIIETLVARIRNSGPL